MESDWFTKDRVELLQKIGLRVNAALGGMPERKPKMTREEAEASYEWMKTVSKIEQEDRPRIKDEIFCGSLNWSPVQIALLFLRIQEGISTLSGMQQNGGQGTAFDYESDRKDKIRLEEICREVVAAFGQSHILKEQNDRPH